MLRIYKCQSDQLVELESTTLHMDDGKLEGLVWIDLMEPTSAEDHSVEGRFGVSIPTRDEMQEIELSDRLYHERGATYMTMTAITGLEGDDPVKAPITFILKGRMLATVRYAEPTPFATYSARAQRPGGPACETGEVIMLHLIEATIDRIADALERIGERLIRFPAMFSGTRFEARPRRRMICNLS